MYKILNDVMLSSKKSMFCLLWKVLEPMSHIFAGSCLAKFQFHVRGSFYESWDNTQQISCRCSHQARRICTNRKTFHKQIRFNIVTSSTTNNSGTMQNLMMELDISEIDNRKIVSHVSISESFHETELQKEHKMQIISHKGQEKLNRWKNPEGWKKRRLLCLKVSRSLNDWANAITEFPWFVKFLLRSDF